jgi:DNA-binding transcriptional LysR family regulator
LKTPRRPLSPAELAAFHLIITPPPARLSICNSLSVTILTIESLAVGLVPVRVVQEAFARPSVRGLAVSPPVPGHRVWICHQAADFGATMQQLVALIREVAAQHTLFV